MGRNGGRMVTVISIVFVLALIGSRLSIFQIRAPSAVPTAIHPPAQSAPPAPSTTQPATGGGSGSPPVGAPGGPVSQPVHSSQTLGNVGIEVDFLVKRSDGVVLEYSGGSLSILSMLASWFTFTDVNVTGFKIRASTIVTGRDLAVNSTLTNRFRATTEFRVRNSASGVEVAYSSPLEITFNLPDVGPDNLVKGSSWDDGVVGSDGTVNHRIWWLWGDGAVAGGNLTEFEDDAWYVFPSDPSTLGSGFDVFKVLVVNVEYTVEATDELGKPIQPARIVSESPASASFRYSDAGIQSLEIVTLQLSTILLMPGFIVPYITDTDRRNIK